jgi:Apolipoprotein N-acyltransferase
MSNKKHLVKSVLLFSVGFIFLFFSNGNWALSAAIWISAVCLLQFSRLNKPLIGLPLILAAGFISNLVLFRGMLPLPHPLYYLVNFIIAVFFTLPFLTDRLLIGKINGISLSFVFPVAWVGTSFLLTKISPSGSFVLIVNSQSSRALLQIASVAGIYGIIFIVGWFAAIINFIIEKRNDFPALKKGLIVYIVINLSVVMFGILRFMKHQEPEFIKVAGIVYNSGFDKPIKENLAEFRDSSAASLHYLFTESKRNIRKGARIVFWQETALMLLKEDQDSLLIKGKQLARDSGIYLGMSVLLVTENFPETLAENKIIWVSPEGNTWEYKKAYPTPNEPTVAGPKEIFAIPTPYGNLSSVICFDMDFPEYLHQAGKKKIDIMCVPASDWRAITPYHAEIVALRAIEQGFNVVRCTGNGLSVAFDCYGRYINYRNAFYTNHRTFITNVPLRGTRTIYAQIGDLFAWLNVAALLILIGLSLRGKTNPT